MPLISMLISHQAKAKGIAADTRTESSYYQGSLFTSVSNCSHAATQT